MSLRKVFGLILGLATTAAFAQQASQAPVKPAKKATEPAIATKVPDGGVPRYIKPETPEQRQDRLGTAEDPGPDPDPKTVFWRFGKQYTISKTERRHAQYAPEPGWVRPLAQMPFKREIYQENDKYIWVWDEVIDRQAREAQIKEKTASRLSDEYIAYYRELREEFSPLTVPSRGSFRFEEASEGLPQSGSWRNGAAVADMNEDGILDLVLPPQRGPAGSPSIYLGDRKGRWNLWKTTWPRRFNYGTVVAADFNKDKHLDLAFSIHLTGVAVFLGNGKGTFREVDGGLSERFATRRLVVADVDADGWSDLVALTEGPVTAVKNATPMKLQRGHMRAYLNRGKGLKWEGRDIAGPREHVGGDYLSTGYFNGDRYPDFIGSSVYFNSAFTLYLSKDATDHDPWLQGLVVPGRSYYHATTAGPFVRGSKTDDAIVSYSRRWPTKLDPSVVPVPPAVEIGGIDRISFAGGSPVRTSIVRWAGRQNVRGLANGDFDGDGNLDLAYVPSRASELVILLGDGKGNFEQAAVEGVKLPPQRTYDLLVRDLNGDRKPDVLLMFEAAEATAFSGKNGSVRVYLNRGVGSGASQSAK